MAQVQETSFVFAEPLNFEWLLDYELRSARRYRYFVSLVVIISSNGKIDVEEIRQTLNETLRESDEVFVLTDELIVVMGHTEGEDALKAVRRYTNCFNCDVDFRYVTASYPRDGGTTMELLKATERRVAFAKRGPAGVVVSTG